MMASAADETEVDNLIIAYDSAVTREDRDSIRQRIKKIKSKYSFPTGLQIKQDVWTRGEYLISRNPPIMQLKNSFMLMPHQTFLRKWISPDTRNRSMLLFHGVGVGKTCAAIQIAENFKTMRSGKSPKLHLPMITVIRPKALEGNFDKELKGKCTGSTYEISATDEDSERRILRLIKKYYVDYAPGEFGNMIEKELDKQANQKDFISKEFSDRVIIVDEVHKLRTSSDSQEKKVSDMLNLIVTHARNVKLILLSATPMFDRAEEIQDIMQLLYTNDGVPFQRHDLFRDGKLLPAAAEQLQDFSSRYVSFMREDPSTFPTRLYPSTFGGALPKSRYPKKQPSGLLITAEEQLKYTDIIGCEMSPLQMRTYRQTMINAEEDGDGDGDVDGEDDKGSVTQQVQISNIVYPSDGDIGLYGESGWNRCFQEVSANTYAYQPDILKKYGPILDTKHIRMYSPKMELVLNTIKNSEGVILIYTQYLSGGILPMAVALEHLGFKRYSGNNILSGSGTIQHIRGNYAVITGNTGISPDSQKKLEIAVATSIENVNGDKIKVILVNEVATEGLDLKGIREIHILTPWANMNRLEQIIGRGVRNKSHVGLSADKNNTSIYQYCNLIPAIEPEYGIESRDFRFYRTAELKQKSISMIERVMKQNAVDCVLNKSVVQPSHDKVLAMTTSQGIRIKMLVGDQPFSRACDYAECNHTCIPDVDVTKSKVEDIVIVKESMVSYEKLIYMKLVGEIFRNKSGLSYDKILEQLHAMESIQGDIHPTILKFALRSMVRERTVFTDATGRNGFLIFRSDRFWFQPDDIADQKLLNRERIMSMVKMAKGIPISKIQAIESTDVSGKESESKESLDIEMTLMKMYNAMEAVVGVIHPEKKNLVVWDMVTDRLSASLIMAIAMAKAPFGHGVGSAVESLQRGLILVRDKFIFQYETGDFLVPAAAAAESSGNWVKAQQADKKRFQDSLIGEMKSRLDKRSVMLRGLMDIHKQVPKFKIIDQDKAVSISMIKKGRIGSVCVQTSGFSVDNTLELIREEVRSQIGDEPYARLDDKIKKTELCDIYEYWLRCSSVRKITFMRPAEFSIYKDFLL